MKTTLDLPDDLVREVKLRALQEGRKLKDAIADLLRRGLLAPEPTAERRFGTSPDTGLPIILGGQKPKKETLDPKFVADVLLEQEVDRHRKAS